MPTRGNPATLGGRIRGAVAAVGNTVRGFVNRIRGGRRTPGASQGGRAKS